MPTVAPTAILRPASTPASPAPSDILRAAIAALKSADAAVTVTGPDLIAAPENFCFPCAGAIAQGGNPYYGTYGSGNRVNVVQAPSGAGSIIQLRERMSEPPANVSAAYDDLKERFPGGAPALDEGPGVDPAYAGSAYLFQDIGEGASLTVVAAEAEGIWYAVIILGTGTYQVLVPGL